MWVKHEAMWWHSPSFAGWLCVGYDFSAWPSWFHSALVFTSILHRVARWVHRDFTYLLSHVPSCAHTVCTRKLLKALIPTHKFSNLFLPQLLCMSATQLDCSPAPGCCPPPRTCAFKCLWHQPSGKTALSPGNKGKPCSHLTDWPIGEMHAQFYGNKVWFLPAPAACTWGTSCHPLAADLRCRGPTHWLGNSARKGTGCHLGNWAIKFWLKLNRIKHYWGL